MQFKLASFVLFATLVCAAPIAPGSLGETAIEKRQSGAVDSLVTDVTGLTAAIAKRQTGAVDSLVTDVTDLTGATAKRQLGTGDPLGSLFNLTGLSDPLTGLPALPALPALPVKRQGGLVDSLVGAVTNLTGAAAKRQLGAGDPLGSLFNLTGLGDPLTGLGLPALPAKRQSGAIDSLVTDVTDLTGAAAKRQLSTNPLGGLPVNLTGLGDPLTGLPALPALPVKRQGGPLDGLIPPPLNLTGLPIDSL